MVTWRTRAKQVGSFSGENRKVIYFQIVKRSQPSWHLMSTKLADVSETISLHLFHQTIATQAQFFGHSSLIAIVLLELFQQN